MIVAIIKIDTGLQPVIGFMPAANEAAAVTAFCASYIPPLDPNDYLGVDAVGVDRLLPWNYDFGSSLLVQNLAQTQQNILSDIKDHRDHDRLTNELRAEYPAASGDLFSCSPVSQDNWSKLATLDVQGAVVYPFAVTTYDELATYDLIDTADREAATLAISTVVLTERALAETYITAVLAAVTAAAAQTAADPYLAL